MLKARITKNTKELFTVAEMPEVRKFMNDMNHWWFADQEDTENMMERLSAAAAIISDSPTGFEILKAEAEVAGNSRKDDFLDIWIEFTAINIHTVVEGGVYLSDLIALNDDDESEENLKNHSYSNIYRSTRYRLKD